MTLKKFYLPMILKIEQLGTSTESKESLFSSLQTSALGFFLIPQLTVGAWAWLFLLASPICGKNNTMEVNNYTRTGIKIHSCTNFSRKR